MHQFFRIVEIRTKIVSVSTLTLGFLWTATQGALVHVPAALLLVVATLLVDMGTTAFNSFFDYLHGVDAKETNREEDKVLVHQNVAPGWALLIALSLYALAGVLGLILTVLTSPWVLAVGAISLAVGFFYNGGPKPLSSTPLGELFAGGFLGGVLFLLVVYTQKLSLSWQDGLMALPSSLFIASILTVNNTCDALGDRASGRWTLSLLLGPKLSPFLIPLLGLAAYTAAAIGLFLTRPLESSLLSLVFELGILFFFAALSISGYRSLHGRGYSHQTKGPNMGGISRLFLFFTLGFAGALLLRTYCLKHLV